MNATIEPTQRETAAPPANPAGTSPVAHPKRPAASGGSGKWLVLALLLALIVVGVLLSRRGQEHQALAENTTALNVTTVSVTHAKAGPSENEITLPGNLTAYSEASIFARTNGYLKAWYTDIGAKVKANQVMADIEAPDVDAQLRQADAALSQARANLDIANLNFARQQDLLAKKVASQQEYDQNRTNVDAMKAAVQAAQANMQNLSVLKDFQQIRVPFDGVVTRRNTDVGALISASNGGQELFRVARTDILRVYVYVPQVYAAFVQEGSTAYLDFAEFPGEKFTGKVAHIAGAIDPATRTLETEVEVDNKNGRLFPGAFANVHLSLPLKKAPMVIPVNTLIFRSEGTQVAVVGPDNVVHLVNVTIGQDYGTSLEVTSGITPADRVVVNPSDSLADGTKVQVAPEKPTAK
jgi:RND family efflux transporter MFP subunit